LVPARNRSSNAPGFEIGQAWASGTSGQAGTGAVGVTAAGLARAVPAAAAVTGRARAVPAGAVAVAGAAVAVAVAGTAVAGAAADPAGTGTSPLPESSAIAAASRPKDSSIPAETDARASQKRRPRGWHAAGEGAVRETFRYLIACFATPRASSRRFRTISFIAINTRKQQPFTATDGREPARNRTVSGRVVSVLQRDE
jgi:hypothetical protein